MGNPELDVSLVVLLLVGKLYLIQRAAHELPIVGVHEGYLDSFDPETEGSGHLEEELVFEFGKPGVDGILDDDYLLVLVLFDGDPGLAVEDLVPLIEVELPHLLKLVVLHDGKPEDRLVMRDLGCIFRHFIVVHFLLRLLVHFVHLYPGLALVDEGHRRVLALLDQDLVPVFVFGHHDPVEYLRSLFQPFLPQLVFFGLVAVGGSHFLRVVDGAQGLQRYLQPLIIGNLLFLFARLDIYLRTDQQVIQRMLGQLLRLESGFTLEEKCPV